MSGPLRPLDGHRVLVVARSTTAHANSGGMETSAEAMVSALQQEGAKTALLTTKPGSLTLPAGFQGHDEIWQVSTSSPGRYSKQWWTCTARPGPWQDWQPSLILGEGDSAGSFTNGRPSVPVVTHCHGTTVMECSSALAGGLSGLPRAALNLLRTPSRSRHLHKADLIIAAGPSVVRSLERTPYRIPAHRITTVANSVRAEAFKFDAQSRNLVRDRLGIPSNAHVLLSAGRLATDKGVDTTLKSLTLLKDCYLLIAGDGPEAATLRSLATSEGVADRVFFMGRISPQSLSESMSAADLLLFPTRRREGSPMILLEAAANGLGIVTTDHAGVPDQLECEQIRVLPHHVDIKTLSTQVERALATPAIRDSYLSSDYSLTTLPGRLTDALNPVLVKK